VADVFEALTAERHYRGPMPLSDAFEILERDKEKHFDPEVVDAFMHFYQKEGEALNAPLQKSIQPKDQAVSTATRLIPHTTNPPKRIVKESRLPST
jgi:HD-GYP domain-containing protein (c-di-GMP phosphodiesterase class II)